ncbi:hypothetical protein WICPIJ_007987 [Wickerhamomyces pijperi]|uniref:Inactive metallocarboxypeptidase ECM14 n=1 Tax=Wickerhamomyces pijperi TaxID=599730 RepID=A0A9P8PYZ3_WICPI|nr:hypothetical protein WICPIJ_007987 [Wickerhamomyces pijperi]
MKFITAFSSLVAITAATARTAATSVNNNAQKHYLFEGLSVSDIYESLKGSLSPFEAETLINERNSKVHYSKVDSDVWPLDLSQYENLQVIRIPFDQTTITDRAQFIQSIRKEHTVWEYTDRFMDVQLSNSELDLLNYGHDYKLQYEIIIPDLAQSVYETYPNHQPQAEQDILTSSDFHIESELFFDQYRPLETIYGWLDLLKETYPDLVNIEHLGYTHENREIKALHLSSATGSNPTKKTVVITAGIHAREWISVSTALYVIHQLLTRYGTNKRETLYLNHLDFLIIPVFNPDGYEYTWTRDRLWRKNRQDTPIDECKGIDIDHSFGYHWSRSEDFPCGESYSGEEQFQAVEAKVLDTYINVTKVDHDIYGFLDLHSYTQKILYPYAYSCDDSPRDIENLLELSYGLSKAVRMKKGKHYEVLPACKDRGTDVIPGLGAGSALDYMYHIRARWAFQFKLRDTGTHGFLLPSRSIRPVGKEIYSGIKYFCQFIINPELSLL